MDTARKHIEYAFREKNTTRSYLNYSEALKDYKCVTYLELVKELISEAVKAGIKIRIRFNNRRYITKQPTSLWMLIIDYNR